MADHALIIGGTEQASDLSQVRKSVVTLSSEPGMQTTVVSSLKPRFADVRYLGPNSENINQSLEQLRLTLSTKDTFTLHLAGPVSKDQNGDVCIPLQDQCYSAKILSQKINGLRFKEGIVIIDPSPVAIGAIPYFASSKNIFLFPTLQSARAARTEGDLNHPNPVLRFRAIVTLMTQDEPQRFVPDFIKALEDKSDRVRAAALEALGGVGVFVVPAIHKLRTFLVKNDPITKELAIKAIANGGKATKSSIFDLSLCLGDNDEKVRDTARKALVKLAAVLPQEVTKRLLEMVTELGDENRENAAKALGEIASKKETATMADRVLGLLKTKDAEKLVYAIQAIPNFSESLSGPKKESIRTRFLTALKPYLSDSRSEVKKAAETATSKIHQDSESVRLHPKE